MFKDVSVLNRRKINRVHKLDVLPENLAYNSIMLERQGYNFDLSFMKHILHSLMNSKIETDFYLYNTSCNSYVCLHISNFSYFLLHKVFQI